MEKTISIFAILLFSLSFTMQAQESIKIGSQTWMKKNLDTDRFANGEVIAEAKTDEEWDSVGNYQEPAWCYYDNDPANGAKYGRLYNWFAVADPRGLCPAGWHVPSDEEWTKLEDYLGGRNVAGNKLKSIQFWEKVDEECQNCKSWTEEYRRKVACHQCKDSRKSGRKVSLGTNSSGFSALPGGLRDYSGLFGIGSIGGNGYWWSSTENSSDYVWYLKLNYGNGESDRYVDDKRHGFCVRCLRD
jgi:uncharacterized protein (TIGR02145 family)